MSDKCCGCNCGNSDNSGNEKKRPLKNLTSLTLKWLADRVRRTEAIKAQVAEGTYKVDPDKVAESLSNKDK